MSVGPLVLGTRGSALALAQSGMVRSWILRLHPGLSCEIRVIRTRGDSQSAPPLWAIGGVGIFTKELEEALRSGEADFAVHSLKDMPTGLSEDMEIAAVPRRADPRDALVTRQGLSLEALPAGSAVGTSSLRRMAQLVCARADLSARNLRGNVDTRLGRVASGELAGALLAAAGLERIGALPPGVKARPLPLETFVPAAAQGALGLECRKGDGRVKALLEPLRDPSTETAVHAERRLLSMLGVGCHVPLGVHAAASDTGWTLSAFLAYPDGHGAIRVSETGKEPEALADLVARRLEAAGARPILDFVNEAAEKAMARERR